MLRYGRQTVSVDVDSGLLLFDRKAISFGVERISHERSKTRPFSSSDVNVVPADARWALVLQIVKLQSKIRMVIDSHHNTPREMMFESARVRILSSNGIIGTPSCLSWNHLHLPET